MEEKRNYSPRTKPSSPAMKEAQLENYALRQLKGILANAGNMSEYIPPSELNLMKLSISNAITRVLKKQDARMAKAGTTRRVPKFDFSDMGD